MKNPNQFPFHRISIDGGRTFITPAQALASVPFDVIRSAMDPAGYAAFLQEYSALCHDAESTLVWYLEYGPEDLIIDARSAGAVPPDHPGPVSDALPDSAAK